MRITIRFKLISGFLALLLLFLIAITCNIWIHAKVDTLTDDIMYSKNEQSVLQKITYLVRSTNDDGGRYLMSTTVDSKEKYMSLMNKDIEDVSEQLKLIIKGHFHDNEQLKSITAFDYEWNKYLQGIDASFRALQSKGTGSAQMMYTQVPFDPVINSLNTYNDGLSALISRQDAATDTFKSFVKRFNIIIIAVTLLIGIALALIISGRIVKPVLQVNRQLKEIAEGGGDLTKQIHVKTKDEIGDLAFYFNQMIHNLRNMVQQISSTAQQIASSSDHLNACSQQTGQATEHIAYSMQEMASRSDKQVLSLNESVTKIITMSLGIQQIATNTQEMSRTSAISSEVALSGNQAVQTGIDQMNSIKITILSLAEIIHNLGEQLLEIDQIAAVITELAAQTNLLALNAAIESARAGDYGKGFAVVANEVKKLSRQSDSSAQKITELIQTIHIETNNAVHSMEKTLIEVNDGTTVMNEAGESFGRIQLSVTGVSMQVKDVSAAVEQMSASSDEVVNMINAVSQLSRETASGTQSVSSASEEQLASMEELSSSAAYLANMAEELQSLVRKFKV
ncbi:methyl-accepting chemotaxis protein [Paenibacillus planticolens]|uniref:HAMP domain-containing protein n=1 Tax=Paenibacillus planticolens TaxID=2654976 RepID=A0ABX1ZUF9_9BACL|nr:methyl-accepting chemotaxis protein [Paenibacillus planticolens]NOV03685.1 HAMP domain-containing protein [Paenibacillus planticolens]